MEFEKGRVVFSRSGRDKGRFLAVLSEAGGYCLLVDGKERPLERPKRKNKIHISRTNSVLSEQSMATNREIRKALAAFQAGGEA